MITLRPWLRAVLTCLEILCVLGMVSAVGSSDLDLISAGEAAGKFGLWLAALALCAILHNLKIKK